MFVVLNCVRFADLVAAQRGVDVDALMQRMLQSSYGLSLSIHLCISISHSFIRGLHCSSSDTPAASAAFVKSLLPFELAHRTYTLSLSLSLCLSLFPFCSFIFIHVECMHKHTDTHTRR